MQLSGVPWSRVSHGVAVKLGDGATAISKLAWGGSASRLTHGPVGRKLPREPGHMSLSRGQCTARPVRGKPLREPASEQEEVSRREATVFV